MEPIDLAAPPDGDATHDRRDRLIASLLRERDHLLLLRLNGDEAHLVDVPGKTQIVLFTARPGIASEQLALAIRGVVRKVQPGDLPLHVVVVGGTWDIVPALKSAAPLVQTVKMGFHHLADDGALVLATGQRSELLERAAEKIGETPRPTFAELGAALSKGQSLLESERTVGPKLAGRYGVTASIIVVCGLLGALSYLWGAGPFHDMVLWRMGAGNGVAVRRGEIERLFASTFLHANVIHLLVNMYALWSFGPMLEALLGRKRFVLLYAASGLAGALASSMFRPVSWSVGASGAIWGLMTAAIGIAVRPKGLLPPLLILRMRSRMWTPLVVNALYSFAPGIDLFAHFGGGIAGFALTTTWLTGGLVPITERASGSDAERHPSALVSLAAALSVAAMVVSVGVALARGKPWHTEDPPELERTTLAGTRFSIAIPRQVAKTTQREDGDSVRIFSFGTISEAPVIFEIVVAKAGAPVSSDAVGSFFENEREALEKPGLPDAVRIGPATLVTLGKQTAARVEHELHGMKVITHVRLVDKEEVLVRAYQRPNLPPSWDGVVEKVVESVAPTTQ